MGAASLAEEVFVAARSWAAPLGAEVCYLHMQCFAFLAPPAAVCFTAAGGPGEGARYRGVLGIYFKLLKLMYCVSGAVAVSSSW